MARNSSGTDHELMVRVCDGDRAAFHELYARHGARVYAYARRMLGNDALAEDVRQEAFIRLWQACERWKPRGSVAAYLLRVARNLALNAQRNARLRRARFGEHALECSAPAPDYVIARADLAAQVHAAIEALPDRPREVFSLKFDAGLSYREIAELLDISPRTVQVHIGRAYRMLRVALAELHSEAVDQR